MNISSAIFDRSAPDLASCPDESLPEFAFIGRSNSGKSSLLNMLSGKADLARTSPTPGFTKLINFFTVNKNWRLVDLPGYGFAEGAKKDSARFNQAVSHYLKRRTNLCLVFALIDSGLEPQEMDVDFVEWLARNAVPFVIVFTKTDKNPMTHGGSQHRGVHGAHRGLVRAVAGDFPVFIDDGTGPQRVARRHRYNLGCHPGRTRNQNSTAPLPPEVEPPFSLKVLAETCAGISSARKKASERRTPLVRCARPPSLAGRVPFLLNMY